MFKEVNRVIGLSALFLALAALPARAQSADVSVLKTASPEPVSAGAALTYTITVNSEGPDDAANVVLTDPLPPGVNFGSISSNAGWNCITPAAGTNGTVSCSTPSFSPGSVSFTLATTVDSSVSDATVLVNLATVSSTTADPHASNNATEADSTVAAPPGTTLSIAKSGAPDPVVAGTNLTYTITATNGTAADLDTAGIRDTLPPSTTFVSLAAPGGWSCTTPAAGSAGAVNCATTLMPASSAAQFTLVVKVDPATPAGNLTNQVFFDSSSGGRDATVSTSATTQVTQSADLSVAKSDAPDPVIVGNNIVYTMTVTNAGPSSAPSVTLTDSLPSGTTFVSLVSPAGWSCATPAVGAGGTVTCTAASMALGSAVFTLTVQASLSLAGGTIVTNTVTVASSADPNGANDSASASTTANLNPTTTTVTVVPSSGLVSGQSVTFHANVTSSGPTPAGSVQFRVNGSPYGAPVTLAGGTATLTTSLAAGSYTVSTDYLGGPGFATSSGSAPPFTVAKAPTGTVITTSSASVPVATIPFGVTFNVTPVSPGSGTLTGTVTVTDGQASCVATLPATGCAITFLSTGSRTLTATYSGDANFLPSTSASVTLRVISLSQIPAIGREGLALLAAMLCGIAALVLGRR